MKIGIITMHKVLNFGSALQAYALQRKMTLLGYHSEIIDYASNWQPKPRASIHLLIQKTKSFLMDAILGFPHKTQHKRFSSFYQKYMVCSSKQYYRQNIDCNLMDYDIYCTGSDQVWNPRFINNDTNYLLSFVSVGIPRFAYAASFATDYIEHDKEPIYRQYLSLYNSIAVREQSAVELVRMLTDMKADVVCDPTMLLDEAEWNLIAKDAKFKDEGKYILVYLLGYMFNMRPQVYGIIDKVQAELGLNVIYLNGSRYEANRPNSKLLKNCGPAEFLHLFQNAQFVVTDSFHGTAFSCIFNRPFMGVIRDDDSADSRIKSLVGLVGNACSIVCYKDIPDFSKNRIDRYKCNKSRLEAFRKKSCELLENMIKGCEDKNTDNALC